MQAIQSRSATPCEPIKVKKEEDGIVRHSSCTPSAWEDSVSLCSDRLPSIAVFQTSSGTGRKPPLRTKSAPPPARTRSRTTTPSLATQRLGYVARKSVSRAATPRRRLQSIMSSVRESVRTTPFPSTRRATPASTAGRSTPALQISARPRATPVGNNIITVHSDEEDGDDDEDCVETGSSGTPLGSTARISSEMPPPSVPLHAVDKYGRNYVRMKWGDMTLERPLCPPSADRRRNLRVQTTIQRAFDRFIERVDKHILRQQ